MGKLNDKKSGEFIQEIEFVLKMIELAPNNESSWNYLSGLLGDGASNDYEAINKFIEKLTEKNVQSSFLQSFKLDQLVVELEKNPNDKDQLLAVGMSIIRSLCNDDKIRKNYWMYMGLAFEKKYAN